MPNRSGNSRRVSMSGTPHRKLVNSCFSSKFFRLPHDIMIRDADRRRAVRASQLFDLQCLRRRSLRTEGSNRVGIMSLDELCSRWEYHDTYCAWLIRQAMCSWFCPTRPPNRVEHSCPAPRGVIIVQAQRHPLANHVKREVCREVAQAPPLSFGEKASMRT